MGTTNEFSKDNTINKIITSPEESSEYEFNLINSVKGFKDNYNKSLIQSETRDDSNIISMKEKTIPYRFEWKEGGTKVKIAGKFLDNWNREEEMKKNILTNTYEIILNVPIGKHEFKFIVDGNWICSKNYPIIYDKMNNPNNIIEVTNCNFSYTNNNSNKNNVKRKPDYNCNIPSFDGNNMDASNVPELYIHNFNLNFQTNQIRLKNANDQFLILNQAKNATENNTFKTIPILNHERLSHICFNSEDKSNRNTYISTSITHRNKHKFLTIIYYTPKK